MILASLRIGMVTGSRSTRREQGLFSLPQMMFRKTGLQMQEPPRSGMEVPHRSVLLKSV